MSLSERYENGDYEAVWRELRALGPLSDVRDGHVRDDAEIVATRTMQRVGRVLDRLSQDLPNIGWRFEMPKTIWPNEGDTPKQLAEAERLIGGPLPLSLRAFSEAFGEVTFAGENESWEVEYPDPFMVDARPVSVTVEYEERVEMEWFTHDERALIPLPLAPDALHKADVSGGEPYSMWVPNGLADGLWVNDSLNSGTFVDYLRNSLLNWAGIPGWARQPDLRPPAELLELAESLERF